MDTFQATSWKFRQSEWEPYKYLYEPLKIEQGAIADPLYFDSNVCQADGRTRSKSTACSRSGWERRERRGSCEEMSR